MCKAMHESLRMKQTSRQSARLSSCANTALQTAVDDALPLASMSTAPPGFMHMRQPSPSTYFLKTRLCSLAPA